MAKGDVVPLDKLQWERMYTYDDYLGWIRGIDPRDLNLRTKKDSMAKKYLIRREGGTILVLKND